LKDISSYIINRQISLKRGKGTFEGVVNKNHVLDVAHSNMESSSFSMTPLLVRQGAALLG